MCSGERCTNICCTCTCTWKVDTEVYSCATFVYICLNIQYLITEIWVVRADIDVCMYMYVCLTCVYTSVHVHRKIDSECMQLMHSVPT